MKYFLLLLITACFVLTGAAQNIGINASGSSPDPSAMLDVQSSSKGFLMPRMSTAQRTAITTPAEGLKVYDTDTKSFWYFNGTGWLQLSTGAATNYWALNGSHIFNSNAGNVGIGLNAPSAPLHIKNDNEALRIQGTTPYISFYDNTGVNKAFVQSFNSHLYLGTPATNTTGKMEFYLKNLPVMTMLPSGNIGVGTATPVHKLTVQTATNDYGLIQTDGTVIVGSYIGDFGADGNGGWLGTKTNHPLNFFTNNSLAQMTILPNGNVGIGTTAPVNKFQIGNKGTLYLGSADFSIANGDLGSMAIYQFNTATNITSVTNITLNPKSATPGGGNVGINNDAPANRLQIGSLGNTGFNGNDLAIGNGTNAVAIYQSNANTLIGSSTDIVLKPRNNGQGRVGINTNTPRASLDVQGYVSQNITDASGSFAYYSLGVQDFRPVAAYGGTLEGLPVNVSIYAAQRVVGSEFDALSDARIKNVQGVSNAAADLETVKALRITDYTMKDRVKFGNRSYKKVIAQEVEKVYPQVISKHADFLPNVYQPTTKIEKISNGWRLEFAANHGISAGAKKLRVLLPATGDMQEAIIVAIPSPASVIIDLPNLSAGKIFVYGEEVDDFRTVDYEGLSTLNISATQELARLINVQSSTIESLQQQIRLLEKRLAAIEKK